MLNEKIELNDIFEMKKTHACGCKTWEVIRLGVDLKLKCTGCGHEIMMDRIDFIKKTKKKVVNPNA